MHKETITDVFFDLDHTLWDFEKNSALTFEGILKENQIDIALADFLEVYVPQNLIFWKLYREEKITKEQLRYQRLKTVFDVLEYAVSDDKIHTLAEEYIERLSSYNHLFPNTIEILEYLKPLYRLHIITNGFGEIQHKKMCNASIHPFFEQVIHSEMAGVKKPNPIIFNLALEKAQAVPEQSVMIGDSIEADILGARAIGMHTLHFSTNGEDRHKICPIISDLIEIKRYL